MLSDRLETLDDLLLSLCERSLLYILLGDPDKISDGTHLLNLLGYFCGLIGAVSHR